MTAPNPDRERLKTFFSANATSDAAVYRRWDDLWIDGSFLPFDRHTPNPALDEVLEKHVQLASSESSDARLLESPVLDSTSKFPHSNQFAGRKVALVPGCGRGYDVHLLAAYGFHAVGLEISETAVRACEELRGKVERALAGAEVEGLSEQALEQYKTKDAKIGRGTATFVAGDFFEGPWAAKDGKQMPGDGEWDLVYDYTFLSALPPGIRPKWAARMRDLIRPEGGRLVCVEFPTYKDPSTGGPPWGLPSVIYMAHLGRPGVELKYDEGGSVVLSSEDRKKFERGERVDEKGLVRVAHWKAEKTHEIGKGTDHIGIWSRAGP